MFDQNKYMQPVFLNRTCAEPSILIFQYMIRNNPVTTYQNKGKNRPANDKAPEKRAVVTNNYSERLNLIYLFIFIVRPKICQ